VTRAQKRRPMGKGGLETVEIPRALLIIIIIIIARQDKGMLYSRGNGPPPPPTANDTDARRRQNAAAVLSCATRELPLQRPTPGDGARTTGNDEKQQYAMEFREPKKSFRFICLRTIIIKTA